MDSEPVLDPVLVQRVSILEDLAREDQDELLLLGLEPPGDLLFELLDRVSLAASTLQPAARPPPPPCARPASPVPPP